ncbi:hypothetical protein T492DRAFT_623613 [Pavlovales sp. CCMP2436]|nr:hypothetical protein T492DRAFT_623613 [Pavlovales sp. CCMP2436]
MAKRARGGGTHACPRRGCAHTLGASEYCTLVEGANEDVEDSDSASPDEEPERRFPCDELGCAYSATQSGTLTRHKRTHSGERPFPCDDPGCGYWATTSGHLTAYKRTHSGERPYPCDEPGCKYRAAEAGSLTTHKRTHSGERPFPCDEPGCEYRASTAISLVRHKRTHSGERPFACDEPGCGYRATASGHLTAHKRTHSGEPRSGYRDTPNLQPGGAGGGIRAETAAGQVCFSLYIQDLIFSELRVFYKNSMWDPRGGRCTYNCWGQPGCRRPNLNLPVVRGTLMP